MPHCRCPHGLTKAATASLSHLSHRSLVYPRTGHEARWPGSPEIQVLQRKHPNTNRLKKKAEERENSSEGTHGLTYSGFTSVNSGSLDSLARVSLGA
jgi:hypothetical protein